MDPTGNGNPQTSWLYQHMLQQQQQQAQAGQSGQGNPSQPLGTAGNPSNYTSGPTAQGYGGPGEIAGGGAVALSGVNLPYFQQDRDRLQGLLGGHDPFASGDWSGLISQLQARANGTNSLAAQEYRSAQQDTANQLGGMAHGGASPAAFRQAAIEQGRVGQGMAAGTAMAQTQEQMAAQGQLQNALGSRDQLNQNAYLNILAQQLGLSQEQLKALQGDQNYNLGKSQQDQQLKAAELNAVGGLAGGFAKL